MLYQEEEYKTLKDYLNSKFSLKIKERVNLFYPDNTVERSTYLHNTKEYSSNMLKSMHYLFRYFWLEKQLEESYEN